MNRILSGIETEYGLYVEGRGAAEQVEDAMALVRGYPGECHLGWDYRYESPRADLRGFTLSRLSFDPEDAKFDIGKARVPDQDVRSDRVLPNGARFYNDHGHPEYSTPECLSIRELALHDKAGEQVVLRAAQAMAKRDGLEVRVYKNNTDFHGASYGTHENYLAPRALGFERLYRAIMPMLVARQILTGAGKVGNETGARVDFQISQRADFFSEAANAETLTRRPVFNTRDEPHADPRDWIRVHVIAGDANMIAACTARKVGLVRLALRLEMIEEAPSWRIPHPVSAFQAISRDQEYKFPIQLESRGNWTTAYEVIESYLAAAESRLELDEETCGLISECRDLLEGLATQGPERIRRSVDWAAKRRMLEEYMESEGTDWQDSSLRAFDLEYHNVDPEEGLYHGMQEVGSVDVEPSSQEMDACLARHTEDTRAFARGLAVSKFGDKLARVCWRTMTFDVDGSAVEVELHPERAYPKELADAADVETFIAMLRGNE